MQDSFKCDQCGRQKNPVARKKVTFPRTFSFNYILGMDTFYVRYGSRHVPFINLVCHGTSYQMVIPILGGNNTPNSSEVWEIILRYWVRPFGFPEAVLTDGGPEFQGKGFETYGVILHIIDSNAPWQAGKVERHGMWVKQRLETEIASGTSVVLNEKDLEELCTQLIAHKNQYFSRGGYSPAQLVFGKNVRVPDDLLSEDMQDIPGWEEPGMDPSNPASEASEFARTQAIRARARELAMKHISREQVLQAARAPQREWFKGQVVYVWRRGQRAYPGHVTRSRWTGPGVVIMQSGHTVWVAMRARLWKCSSDQLRAASPLETLGNEVAQSHKSFGNYFIRCIALELEPWMSNVKDLPDKMLGKIRFTKYLLTLGPDQ